MEERKTTSDGEGPAPRVDSLETILLNVQAFDVRTAEGREGFHRAAGQHAEETVGASDADELLDIARDPKNTWDGTLRVVTGDGYAAHLYGDTRPGVFTANWSNCGSEGDLRKVVTDLARDYLVIMCGARITGIPGQCDECFMPEDDCSCGAPRCDKCGEPEEAHDPGPVCPRDIGRTEPPTFEEFFATKLELDATDAADRDFASDLTETPAEYFEGAERVICFLMPDSETLEPRVFFLMQEDALGERYTDGEQDVHGTLEAAARSTYEFARGEHWPSPDDEEEEEDEPHPHSREAEFDRMTVERNARIAAQLPDTRELAERNAERLACLDGVIDGIQRKHERLALQVGALQASAAFADKTQASRDDLHAALRGLADAARMVCEYEGQRMGDGRRVGAPYTYRRLLSAVEAAEEVL